MRLQRFLAECGVASRRRCEELIAAGRVTVNGARAALGASVDPHKDVVELDGKPVRTDEKVYIILNKPSGAITTARDTHQRKTVFDCLEGFKVRLFPVGRLDMDVEGALLMTNDGELAHRLMHPRYAVEKVYLVWVWGRMSPETAARLEQGVDLEDGLTAPAKAVILQIGKSSTLVQLTLREGRKREVKRMCERVGHQVRKLERIAIGGVRVKGLRPGEWRRLTDKEVQDLRRYTGLIR